jgi:hypothetical protein
MSHYILVVNDLAQRHTQDGILAWSISKIFRSRKLIRLSNTCLLKFLKSMIQPNQRQILVWCISKLSVTVEKFKVRDASPWNVDRNNVRQYSSCRGFVNRSAIGVGIWRFVEGGEHGGAIQDGGSTSLPSFRSRNGGEILRAAIIHYKATSARLQWWGWLFRYAIGRKIESFSYLPLPQGLLHAGLIKAPWRGLHVGTGADTT